jgi:hypothetical protein
MLYGVQLLPLWFLRCHTDRWLPMTPYLVCWTRFSGGAGQHQELFDEASGGHPPLHLQARGGWCLWGPVERCLAGSSRFGLAC